MSKEKNQEFEASFTLRQVGKDGDVEAYLDFSHGPTEFDADEEVPAAYERMLSIAQFYLEQTGFTDQHGNLLAERDNEDEVFLLSEASRTLN